MRVLVLVRCSQLCLSSSHIAGFFDRQYHCKEPIHIFDFWHGGNCQGKVVSKTNTLSWVWPDVPLFQSDSRNLWSSISLDGINRYLCLTIVVLSFFTYFPSCFVKLSWGPLSYDLFFLSLYLELFVTGSFPYGS